MRRIAVAAWLCAAEALAQGRPLRPLGPVPPTVEAAPSSALGARFGVSAAQRLLASTDPDERLRGIARLGDDGSREAVEALVRAMDPGSPAVRDPRARLLAIRALARHASDEGPRGVLLRAMSEALPPDRTPTASLIGETAALGLARYGGTRGTEVLAAIVRQGGRLGDVASAALIAHPPPSLDALAGPKAPASAEVARLLGELGDLRATPWLRAVVRMDEPALRSAALLALAQLGDQEATVVSRAFARALDPRAKLAAARALSIVAPSEARPIVAELLAVPDARADALDLAERLGGGVLSAALAPLSASGPLEQRRRAVMALGLSPARAGLTALVARLEPGDLLPSVVLSLGLARSDAVAVELGAALKDDARRPLAYRVATVRALSLGEALPDDARGVGPEARAFVALARGDAAPTDAELQASPALASAVALGALARGPAALAALDAAFCRADGAAAHALAVVLLGESRAPAAHLWALAESRGPASALAVFALAARDDADSRRRLDALASSPDPMLRAHALMGLARSTDPSRAGRIASAYEGERDPLVRRAIVRALRGAPGPAARAVLELARELDPDVEVRRAARAVARAGGGSAELVTVVGAAPGSALMVERPDGLALPVFVGPDGVALVPRASAGVGRASVAPSP